MSRETINQDGTPVLIEAVYWQYHTINAEEFDSIEQATGFLEDGEEYGTLSSVGVFVDGQPRVYKYGDIYDMADANLDQMRAEYAEAKGTRFTGNPPPALGSGPCL